MHIVCDERAVAEKNASVGRGRVYGAEVPGSHVEKLKEGLALITISKGGIACPAD